jgi:hypothetical protein
MLFETEVIVLVCRNVPVEAFENCDDEECIGKKRRTNLKERLLLFFCVGYSQ